MTKLDEILMSDEIYAQAWADDVPESVITSVISGLSAAMEDALLYEVRITNREWAIDSGSTPRPSTMGSLIRRGLLSHGTYHRLTNLGREVARRLFMRISVSDAPTTNHAGVYGWFYRDVAEHPQYFIQSLASGRIVSELDTAWTEAHEMEAAPYRAGLGSDADGRTDQSCVLDRRTGQRVSQWFVGRTTVTGYGIALTWNTGNHVHAIEQRFVVRTSPDFQTARVIDTVLVQVAEQFEGLNAYHRATWLARAKNNVADQANTPVVWDARAHI